MVCTPLLHTGRSACSMHQSEISVACACECGPARPEFTPAKPDLLPARLTLVQKYALLCTVIFPITITERYQPVQVPALSLLTEYEELLCPVPLDRCSTSLSQSVQRSLACSMRCKIRDHFESSIAQRISGPAWMGWTDSL